ncbi:MAG: PAS domain S-box protein [Promethearchaeota archaeon]
MQDSEEKYQTILENIEEGYYEVDLAGNFTFFNDSMCKILGYSKDEMTGMNYRQYMNDQVAKAVYKIFNKVYRTGIPTKIVDYKITRKDKTSRDHETSISLMIGSKGEAIGFRGIVRDITERKDTERKLRESEEKYRTILKSIEDGYYEVDLAGNFTFFNDSMCKILGYSKDEMIGMNYRQYTSDHAAKAVYKIFNKVYRTGIPAKIVDYEIIRKDKTSGNHETSVSLIINSEGEPVGFRGIVRDITERKELEKAKEDLERRRADFISMTSHEIRTPLTIIKGYESFLKKNLNNLSQEKIEDHFKHVNRNISRIERLINGVSDIGRIERGIFDIKPKKTSLPKFLNEVMQPHIELLGSQFQYERIPEELACDFNIDESRLIQVLDNLIDNAIKHTDANQRKISVTTEILPDLIRITASDNGAGIKLENLQKIFQPFTSFSTEYSTKGTGIGLFVCKMIIEHHYGRITAHSDGEGRGSSFIIELPRIPVKEI